VNRLLKIALGLVSGIGGFLEAGSLATSGQASDADHSCLTAESGGP
jgi:hypothetical protein